jgi:hypothetical protein
MRDKLEHLTGSEYLMRWYQQLWCIKTMLLPVRYHRKTEDECWYLAESEYRLCHLQGHCRPNDPPQSSSLQYLIEVQ